MVLELLKISSDQVLHYIGIFTIAYAVAQVIDPAFALPLTPKFILLFFITNAALDFGIKWFKKTHNQQLDRA